MTPKKIIVKLEEEQKFIKKIVESDDSDKLSKSSDKSSDKDIEIIKPKIVKVETSKKMTKKEKEDQEISNKYQKLDQREHILLRSAMYIGSTESDQVELFVLNNESNKMVKETLKYNAGLYKIFDEILTNSVDHSIRLKSFQENDPDKKINLLKNIKVNIEKDTGIISVFNDGDGLDIILHPDHKIYIPELIFGNLLSGTNYDDSIEREGAGLNGLGSKCTNIFSKWFEVETVDANRKLLYKQKFESNMSVKNPPIIEKYTKKPYTKITFLSDYARFGMKDLTEDMYKILKKRVYDAIAVTDNDVNIYFNEDKLEFKSFEKYVDLYLGDKTQHSRVYEKCNERWEVVASYNEYNGFQQISFTNGIWTIKGGKHVDYIVNQIIKKLTELIQKKKKNVTIKPSSIKDNLFLFIKCTIVNPTFDSQSKETLTTPFSKFGSKCELSDKFIEKLYKSGIVEKILEISEIQDNKKLAKTDGKKKTTIRGLAKLEDASLAGTARSSECTLVLCEGDSAVSTALAGIPDRKVYGAFPLKGKIMNVKDQTVLKISSNDEINALKKIIGLETGKKYEDISELRYGKIMLMTDQDVDASHIRGLFFNLIHSLWPSLISQPNFICSLMTPIIKMTKGKEKIQFYNLIDYENWLKNNSSKGWTIKYFKGLATSTSIESKEYFKNMQCVDYKYTPEKSDVKINLAFNKKQADDRKEWLANYDRQAILNTSQKEVTYEDFIDKELIHFSTYDNQRSLPNIADGLKTSQRKILYSCFKRNLTGKEVKVAQLSGYVSENSNYHHGENSLQGAIINMGQNYIGSNNINLLMPNGNFGSRYAGGSDAGSPRYIFTVLNPLTSVLYSKADMALYEYIDDDGDLVEPFWYLPIIPMVLVNSVIGIGTGFSTNIPCYNPTDIVSVIYKLLNNENIDDIELTPWIKNYKGTIEKKSSGKYISRGIYKKITSTSIQITELPAYIWTLDYKEFLEEYLEKNPTKIKNYISNCTDCEIDFTIQFTTSAICDSYLEEEDNGYTKFENEFKLVSSKNLSTTNMYMFNTKCQIQKYDSPIDIICDYYFTRLEYYQKRKDYLLKKLQDDIDILNNKIRFIKAVVNEEIIVHKIKKDELVQRLEDDNYMKLEDNYNYLIHIEIFKFTKDMVEKLEKEKKEADDEIERIKSKTKEVMWKDDLELFKVEYDKFINETSNSEKKKKVTVKK